MGSLAIVLIVVFIIVGVVLGLAAARYMLKSARAEAARRDARAEHSQTAALRDTMTEDQYALMEASYDPVRDGGPTRDRATALAAAMARARA